MVGVQSISNLIGFVSVDKNFLKVYSVYMNDDYDIKKCPNCNGYGTIGRDRLMCPTCRGRGIIIIDPITLKIIDNDDGNKNITH